MNQSHKITRVLSGVAVCFAIGILSGCSTTSSKTTAAPTSNNSATPGPTVAGKDIFSDLRDLKYTPSGQGEYKIAPNDLLLLDVFRVKELSRLEARVSETGTISLPLVGTMKAMGLSQQQLEKQLKVKLAKTYLQNPQVTLSIKEFTSKEVTVGGSVKVPGVFPMKSSVTLSQGIALAGGLVPLADPQKVVLFRPNKNGTFKAYNVDLTAIRNGKMRDPYLNGKDQIIVHESGSRVWLGRVTNVMRGFVNPFSVF